ncbi:hypothetical protein BH10BAC3_BH10BAC3_04770 [soil metagenome]
MNLLMAASSGHVNVSKQLENKQECKLFCNHLFYTHATNNHIKLYGLTGYLRLQPYFCGHTRKF